MKNPLADVLRQSTGSEAAISDSGSFETSGSVLGPTANDENVVADDAIDLQLLEATGALVIENGTVQFEAPDRTTAVAAPLPDSVAATLGSQSASPQAAPLLSRFAPLICVLAALLSAVSWTVYRQMQAAATQNSIGTQPTSAGNTTEPLAGTVRLAGAERFPFINPAEIPAADQEEGQ